MSNEITFPQDSTEGADLAENVPKDEANTPANTKVPSFEVDGDLFFWMPVKVSVEQHVRALRKMTMRDDDVLVVAFPKSGTHWIWEVVHMLVSGKVEYEPRAKEHLMLEFTDVDKIDALESPRILNSHLVLRHLSTEIVEKRTPVIHVLRNPKDIVVSLYHHQRQFKNAEDINFNEFVKQFLTGGILPGSDFDYFHYLAEMEKWQQDHPDCPVLNVYFEDVKKDPVTLVRKIAQFLGVEISEAMCANIANACSFEKLKEADERKDSPGKHFYKDDNPKIFRKGEVGDWKNHFTVALNEMTDAVFEEKLKNCTFKFQYSI